MFTPALVRGASPDPDDDKFVATIAAKADYLVTGNKRGFRKDQIASTKLVSAGELLDIVTLNT